MSTPTKCPQCGDPTIQPRDSEAYCENCGWPDENREADPGSVVDEITSEILNVVAVEGHDNEEWQQVHAVVDKGIEPIRSQLAAKDEELAELRADKERLRGLRELCGYVENGSDTVVTLFQDDATKDWFCKVGKTSHWGNSFDAAIDAARQQGGQKP